MDRNDFHIFVPSDFSPLTYRPQTCLSLHLSSAMFPLSF